MAGTVIITAPLVLASAILLFAGIFISWHIRDRTKEFYIFLLILAAATIGVPARMKDTNPSEMIATSNWLVANPSHHGGRSRSASHAPSCQTWWPKSCTTEAVRGGRSAAKAKGSDFSRIAPCSDLISYL